MADTKTLSENTRSPVTGAEGIRLATAGANWVATIGAIFGTVTGVTDQITAVGTLTAGAVPRTLLTGLGTGVSTALGVNIGSAGAPVLFNGAGGTPSSLTGTNISGTAASLTAGNVSGANAGALTSLQLGVVSTTTGQLLLANSASANLTTIQAGNAAAARTYTWPTNFGAAGTVLTDAAGNGTLSWAAAGSSTLTANSTATSGFSAGQLIYSDGSLIQASTGWVYASSVLTNTQAISATSTDGIVLQNTTAATVGAQKWSPRLHLTGNGWQTALPGSEKIDWIVEAQPVQGATHPTNNLVFSAQVNSGGYSPYLTISVNAAAASSFTTIGTTVLNSLGDGSGTIGTAASRWSGIYVFNAGVNIVSNTGPLIFGASSDVILVRGGAAATLTQGGVPAASPVAQTHNAQSSRSGTDSNVGGANFTLQSGNGTGTGTLSSLILQSPVAVGSGSGAQTQTTGLAIKAGAAVLTSYTVATLPAAATAGAGATAFVTDASTTLVLGLGGAVTGGGANKVPVYSDGTSWNYG